MNVMDPKIREIASQEARAHRLEMYADWLEHDVDGLRFTLASPANVPFPHATAILAEARRVVALALHRIDLAIEADKAAHAAQEQA